MDKPFNTRLGFSRKEQRSFPIPGTESEHLRPHGRYGMGLIGGAAGSLVVVALMLTLFLRLPLSLLFFLPALFLGSIVGFILWLRHR